MWRPTDVYAPVAERSSLNGSISDERERPFCPTPNPAGRQYHSYRSASDIVRMQIAGTPSCEICLTCYAVMYLTLRHDNVVGHSTDITDRYRAERSAQCRWRPTHSRMLRRTAFAWVRGGASHRPLRRTPWMVRPWSTPGRQGSTASTYALIPSEAGGGAETQQARGEPLESTARIRRRAEPMVLGYERGNKHCRRPARRPP